jgi:cytochrome c-type biogenesis protein CcmH/NrfG
VTAIQRFNQAYLLTPERAQVFWGLAIASSMQQQFRDAEKLFDRAMKAEPANVRLMSDAGRSFLQEGLALGQRERKITPEVTIAFEKADRILRAAVKVDPKSALPWAHIAALSLYRNDVETARGAVREAQRLGGEGLDPRLVADVEKASSTKR